MWTLFVQRYILSHEVGKTLADAEAEFERGIDALETACSESEISGAHFVNHSTEIHTIHEPLVRTLITIGRSDGSNCLCRVSA